MMKKQKTAILTACAVTAVCNLSYANVNSGRVLSPIHFLLLKDSSEQLPQPEPTGVLNDTGITWSGNFQYENNTTCISSNTPDGDNVVAEQDCSHGRDATDNDDSDGQAGFSFTKLDRNGKPLSDQTVSYTETSWACVKDNVTGLIWEVKTDDSGLHDKDDRYNWYNTDSTSNAGAVGSANNDGDICYGYDSNKSVSFCNTEAYVNRVNAAGWCGASDWRMPTRKELADIVHHGINVAPVIDTSSFSNAVSDLVWAGTPNADNPDSAWSIDFKLGDSKTSYRNNENAIRLVRGGQ
ncbi:MAG: DUF1566 domain-containing protein [Candidatus Electrothrix sp. MAN1_4]|nr:DUF1566 domain-containing protein [Candidatus Electrothrix sp. MAN1_4]